MTKRNSILLALFLVAVVSLFLPYRTYVPSEDGWLFLSEGMSEHLSGLQMGAPVFSLIIFLLGFILVGFVRTKSSSIIALIGAALNCIYMPFIYFLIHFQLFNQREIKSGMGFFVLCAASVGLLFVIILWMIRPDYKQREARVAHDLLDDF